MTIELSIRDLQLIIIGMTSGNYPLNIQKEALELAVKLRDKLNERK